MKSNKHISFILALLILVSNVGLAFNVHYCGDTLAGISLNYKESEPCVEQKSEKADVCCATSDEHESCCSNDKIELKKSISDEVITKSFQLELGVFTLSQQWEPSVPVRAENEIVKNDFASFYCLSNAPPRYKLYCQYLFYDQI